MYSVKNNRIWGLQRQGIPAHSSKHNFGISFQRIGGKPQLVMGGIFGLRRLVRFHDKLFSHRSVPAPALRRPLHCHSTLTVCT